MYHSDPTLPYYHMTGRRIPEYYPTMYLDGYTPTEIWWAMHKKNLRLYREMREREAQKKADAKPEEPTDIHLEVEVKNK